ncbi:MAG: type IV pilus biogenesis/stability protein PilW [Methylococcaceae bacterium]|nr:type IV pilus biogenesis/stability protein PilW [Methylococcaceae bacterium]
MLLQRLDLLWIFMAMLLVGCSSSGSHNLSSDQASADVQAKLGVEYLRLGKLDVALEKLESALALDSNNIDAQDAIAVLYEKIKQYPNARKHFEAALALQPENAGTLNNFGRFLCDRGEYEEAFDYLKKAMDMPLNDKKWFAFTNAGRCELLRGNQTQAEANFRLALEHNNKFAPALLELQRISYRQGNFLSAKAFVQRYEEVAEHTAGTLWVAIETEKALGNQQLAEQYRQQLLQNFGSSHEAKQIRAIERVPTSNTTQ